ncbi:macrocin O-methyltransferase [Actinomadura sp. KC06]|uniref:TylF/MycF family methyltransferase n=1 Tax=Actinomadura sp. KC06 TaxID=2530369 RepID=UPI001047BBD3|nr:TylF/MycF family methyltransferase [Actinomadura sp. KC06]TDD37560.1 macrocin O-methyltransferase [Actinomadura sp. KC06]
MRTPRELYLDLVKRTVANTIYQDADIWFGDSWEEVRSGIRKQRGFDTDLRAAGADLPSVAHTMIGLRRLDNVQMCVERVIADGVPGDLIETGVWRGGASIFMRAVLAAHGVRDRVVWVADSFEGLPEPDGRRYPADRGAPLHVLNDLLGVDLATVEENFRRYGLLDDQVAFLKGWFRDTLPGAPIERLAVLRMDGDLYESTHDALVHLYPKLQVGGFVIVDDYFDLAPCRLAVRDYRAAHGIDDPIERIDQAGGYWRRSA